MFDKVTGLSLIRFCCRKIDVHLLPVPLFFYVVCTKHTASVCMFDEYGFLLTSRCYFLFPTVFVKLSKCLCCVCLSVYVCLSVSVCVSVCFLLVNVTTIF